MNSAAIVCWLIVGGATIGEKAKQKKAAVCQTLYELAAVDGLDPVLIVSIAWHESAFRRRAKSTKGAIGLLQVLPRYFCPQRRAKNCDTTKAGFKAFRAWSKLSRNRCLTLCKYNGGHRCGRAARGYARRVAQTYTRAAGGVNRPGLHCPPSEFVGKTGRRPVRRKRKQ